MFTKNVVQMPYFDKACDFQNFISHASYFSHDFFEFFQKISLFYFDNLKSSKDEFVKKLTSKAALKFYYSLYRFYEFFYIFFDSFDEKIQVFFKELKHYFYRVQKMIFQNQDLKLKHFFSQKLISFINSKDFHLFLVNLEFFITHAFLFQNKSEINFKKIMLKGFQNSTLEFLQIDEKGKKLFENYYQICILFEILNPFFSVDWVEKFRKYFFIQDEEQILIKISSKKDKIHILIQEMQNSIKA